MCESGYTPGSRRKIARKGTHGETRVFRMGWYYYPRSVPHVHEHPRAGYQNGKLCRFWILAGCTPEERREPSGQRCAYARRCPEASRPRRAAQLYLFIGVFTFVKDLAGCCQYSSQLPKVPLILTSGSEPYRDMIRIPLAAQRSKSSISCVSTSAYCSAWRFGCPDESSST